MDPGLIETARALEQQLSMLGRLDATQFRVAVESLGVVGETHKKLFYVIVALYRAGNDETKALIVEMIATIVPYTESGPVDQIPQATMWELVVKLWKIVEGVPSVQAWDRLRNHLALIWGDEFAKDIPFTLREAILHLGITAAELPTVSLEEFAKRIRDNQPQTPLFDRIYLALDLLFEARYNWPQGTAKTKTPQDLLLALEHALEFTPENRTSIWDMT